MKPNNHFFSFKNQNSLEINKKKGTLKIQKSQIDTLVLIQSPNSTVPWVRKNSTIRAPPVFCLPSPYFYLLLDQLIKNYMGSQKTEFF